MTGSKSLGRILALVCIVLACLPAVALGAPMPWRLDPWDGWEALEPVNPYATIQAFEPISGWGNASSSSVQIMARAEVAFDVSKAELTADFMPVSKEIIESDPRLFVASLGRRLEWKIILTVRNPNDIPMQGAKVQGSFGPAFRATLAGRSRGDARITGDDPRGMLPMDANFLWDVGDLGPNEAARAEISVATRRDSSGRQEFTQEGVYPIDTGFKLTYSLLGKAQVRNTSPCSVIARVNPEALRPDSGPYDVAQKPIEQNWPSPVQPFPERPVPVRPVPVQPGVGGSVPIGGGQGGIAPSVSVKQSGELAMITRDHHFVGENVDGFFQLVATGVSDNVGVEDDKFTVPAGEEAEWRVEVQVDNRASQPPSTVEWNGWTVTLLFGEHLTADEIERSVSLPDPTVENDGELTIETDYPEPGITRVRLIWRWQQKANKKFVPGSRAYLALKVKTNGLPPSDKDLIFCDSINMEYNPGESGYVHNVPLKDIFVTTGDAPPVSIEMSANRLDWRIRRPDIYAGLATEIAFSGGAGTDVQIQLEDFGDLVRIDGQSPSIPAFYSCSLSSALPELDSQEWFRGNATRTMRLGSTQSMTVYMWAKIHVGEEHSPGKYENKGVITFIISNR